MPDTPASALAALENLRVTEDAWRLAARSHRASRMEILTAAAEAAAPHIRADEREACARMSERVIRAIAAQAAAEERAAIRHDEDCCRYVANLNTDDECPGAEAVRVEKIQATAYAEGCADEQQRWREPLRDLLALLSEVSNYGFSHDHHPGTEWDRFSERQDKIERELGDLLDDAPVTHEEVLAACPDIERWLAEDEGPFSVTMDTRRPVPPYGTPERARWNAEHPDDDRSDVPGSGGRDA